MPELPEVETVRRGIEPHVASRRITAVRIREPRLRWPVPPRITTELPGQVIERVTRRAKYLLLAVGRGHLLIHLGMSGSLRVLPEPRPPQKHDHLDIELDTGACLRFRDPRRFGSVLFTTRPPERHRLLRALGPEPLSDAFNGEYLYRRSRGRRVSAKAFLMDSRIVAGVGNIYASEALHRAGIHPARPAGRTGAGRYDALATAVRETLLDAIDRVARGVAISLGVPDDLLPEVTRSATETTPPTINDRATAERVRTVVTEAFGDEVLWTEPREGMGAEDFAYFVTPDSGVKGVYFNVGGTLPENLDDAASHHSPYFRIEPEPAISMATETMVRAATDLFRAK